MCPKGLKHTSIGFFPLLAGRPYFKEHLMILIIVTSHNLLMVALVFPVEAQGKRTLQSRTDISLQYIFRGSCLFHQYYKAKIYVKSTSTVNGFLRNVESSLYSQNALATNVKTSNKTRHSI